MDKLYNVQLPCGCLIAEDTGTTDNPNGDAGLIPCHYDDSDKEQVELCRKSWEEYKESS